MPTDADITDLMRLAGSGDVGAEARLYQHVHDRLRRRASGLLSAEGAGHTLQTTALLDEAWLRIGRDRLLELADRQHLYGSITRAMRNVLIDCARHKIAGRRGRDAGRISLDPVLDGLDGSLCDLLDLNEALERLAKESADLARLIELRFFGGLSLPEVAEMTGVSLATAERRWRVARLWLRSELGPG